MRYAMNRSHNTAAAQALMTYVGIENSVAYLLRLGVDPDHINANGSGLALGSSSLSVIELAAGFGAVGNLGEYLEPYAFTRIENSDGSIYIDIDQVQLKRQVFKESTAWMLVDVLKGCVTSGVGTGSQANFRGMEIAGKTGTNSDNVGVTFAGMSAYYSAAVWIGSDNRYTYSPGQQRHGRQRRRAAVVRADGGRARRHRLHAKPRHTHQVRLGSGPLAGELLRRFRHDAHFRLRARRQRLRHQHRLLSGRHRTGHALQHAPLPDALHAQRHAGDEQLPLHHRARRHLHPRGASAAQWPTTWPSCASISTARLPARKNPAWATATACG